jgi:hypothetical protein
MTVRAPHLAFRDLGEHSLPCDTGVHEATHSGALIAQMIEVEHIRIRLTAVDAGMIAEVLADPEGVGRGPSNSADVSRSDLAVAVSEIPVFRVSTLAGEADPLARLTNERTEWEVAQGFRFFADATDPQPGGGVQWQLQLGPPSHERLCSTSFRRGNKDILVLRLWQLAQRTSHLAISDSMRVQVRPEFAYVDMSATFRPR